MIQSNLPNVEKQVESFFACRPIFQNLIENLTSSESLT
jgi:hypothetical protein